MADDGKLYIIISDKREGVNGEVNNSADFSSKKEKEKKSSQSIITHQFYNFMIGQAKQFVNYNINNIGNFTGDYISQRRISEAMQAVNIATNIGGAFVSGMMMSGGNPVVGAAAAAIATAGVAINAGYQSYAQRVENAKMNYNIDQLRKRSGLNAYKDGSRGTEN